MDPQDLLFTNQFVSQKKIDVNTIQRNSKNYNNFIQNRVKNNNPTRDFLINDQKNTQELNEVLNRGNPWPIYNDNKSPVLSTTMEDVSKDNYAKRYVTSVVIDSRDRNQNTNILPNNYTVSMPKEFENIEKIELKNINLNNTIPPINNSNNSFTWSYPKQGDTAECINADPFFRNKFVRGQMPEYLFSRSNTFISEEDQINTVFMPNGFYSVDSLKEKLISKLNKTNFSFGDPGVATDVHDYIDPDSYDIDSMNYKKLMNFQFVNKSGVETETENEFSVCNFDKTNHSEENPIITILPPSGIAIPCKTNCNLKSDEEIECKSNFVIIELNKDITKDCIYTCEDSKCNKCSAKYYDLTNEYNFSEDNDYDYIISPSDSSLFEDINGEIFAKNKNIKFYSEAQFVYKKSIINFGNTIYNPCSYLDFNYYIPYVYDDRIGFYYEGIHPIRELISDESNIYDYSNNGMVMPIQKKII